MIKFILISLLAIALILPANVLADVGIGLKWGTEGETVQEDVKHCVTYFLYNPFDTDVMGYLKASGELEELVEAEEAKLIPAGTSSDEAIATAICFNVPKIYEETCGLGGFSCERLCEEPQKIYKGEVQAAYNLNYAGGTGSATGTSVSARMKLLVNCKKVEKDPITGFITEPTTVYAGVAVLIILVVLLRLRRKGGGRKKEPKMDSGYRYTFTK